MELVQGKNEEYFRGDTERPEINLLAHAERTAM